MSNERCGKPTKTGEPCRREAYCPIHPPPVTERLRDALEWQAKCPEEIFDVRLLLNEAVYEIFDVLRQESMRRTKAGEDTRLIREVLRRLSFEDLGPVRA